MKEGIVCICSRCNKHFRLVFDDHSNDEQAKSKMLIANIDISACQSGGVYGASIECPYCHHNHDLAY